jgi:epoxyqueuosine reductase
MTYDVIEHDAMALHLRVLGGFHPTSEDNVPEGCKTLIMLGPDESAFWPYLQTQPEYLDCRADPIDRWSRRVIDGWAKQLNAISLYPFGGPPYLSFFSWALRTGRVHKSPILLLVHDRAGLFVSFRGALALREHIDLPAPPPNPCETCSDQPCNSACPVDALTDTKYDVPACRGQLDAPDLADCMGQGCAARRACPVSKCFGRLPEQSAYHMRKFVRQ